MIEKYKWHNFVKHPSQMPEEDKDLLVVYGHKGKDGFPTGQVDVCFATYGKQYESFTSRKFHYTWFKHTGNNGFFYPDEYIIGWMYLDHYNETAHGDAYD